MPVLFKTT